MTARIYELQIAVLGFEPIEQSIGSTKSQAPVKATMFSRFSYGFNQLLHPVIHVEDLALGWTSN